MRKSPDDLVARLNQEIAVERLVAAHCDRLRSFGRVDADPNAPGDQPQNPNILSAVGVDPESSQCPRFAVKIIPKLSLIRGNFKNLSLKAET